MNTKPQILLRGGRVIDPSQNLDRVMNVLVEDGRITAYDIQPSGREIELDVSGKIVAPGLIDLHTHLREPGGEDAETIASGCNAAVNGGYTSIACIPNTNPPIDTPADVEFIRSQAAKADRCNVYVVACISKERKGEELSEMGHLAKAGAVAFSDDGSSVANAELMRRAFEYAKICKLPIFDHCEDLNLANRGTMNEGLVSMRLGLRGIPAAAEDVMTARDIMLTASTGGRLHVMHVSTARSVDLVRRAKQAGINVTAEVTPHHLTLTEECMTTFDSNFKMSPPLRTQADVDACRAGLLDGTLDCVSTDHAPHSLEKKQREIDIAPFGVTGLETALGVLSTELVHTGIFTWNQLIEKMSTNPARILGIERGTLAIGSVADIVVIDPELRWTVTPECFLSRSTNNAYLGREFVGRATTVLVGGRIRLSRK